MKLFALVLLLLSIIFCFISQAFAVTIISTFDVDEEGWTGEATKETITYQTTGGNPGGFLSIEDLYWAETASTFPPSKFKGDLSEFDGGFLTYDLLLIKQPTTPIPPNTPIDGGLGRINLVGSGGNITFDYVHYPVSAAPYPSTQYWTTYYVPLEAKFWLISDTEHATQEIFEKALSDVTYFDIILDIGGQGIIGVDNFKLEPIPEPTTLSLLGLGLLGIGMFRKKDSGG